MPAGTKPPNVPLTVPQDLRPVLTGLSYLEAQVTTLLKNFDKVAPAREVPVHVCVTCRLGFLKHEVLLEHLSMSHRQRAKA